MSCIEIGEERHGGRSESSFGTFTPTHFEPKCHDVNEWIEAGTTLRELHNSVLWWVGDWLRFGKAHFGEQHSQALGGCGYSIDMLRRAENVSGFYSRESRFSGLSWTHHRIAMRTTDARSWLDRAEKEQWSSRRLQEEITASNKVSPIADEQMPIADNQVGVSAVLEMPVSGYYVELATWDDLECWLRDRIGSEWTDDDVLKVSKAITGR